MRETSMPSNLFPTTIPLCELTDGQEADMFVLMTAKDEAKTRDGKPYFRVAFRDGGREVSFPIWSDSAHAEACRKEWAPGAFYKVRAMYRETSYGAQLEIRKIRPVMDADARDGFDPLMCQPRSKFEAGEMFGRLLGIARDEIADRELSALTASLLETHRERLLTFPAAVHHHHAFSGGFLEHVLSVTRNALFLADKYLADYPEMYPPLSRDLVVAGAILHDIGKLRELETGPAGAAYTPEGELVGHILLGRDMVRETAAQHKLSPETLLRLEHIIVSHQRLPEWGSPKPPMTPEALLVHFADDCDAKFQMMYAALADVSTGAFTSKKNPLQTRIFRGLPAE
jgi:3'-5' exoribonuclease